MATINNIPRSFQVWAGIGATPPDFNLDSGTYGLTLSATAWGTAQLNQLQPDGVTYLPVLPAAVAANGYQVLSLPAGQYQLTLAGVTALKGQIALIARNATK